LKNQITEKKSLLFEKKPKERKISNTLKKPSFLLASSKENSLLVFRVVSSSGSIDRYKKQQKILFYKFVRGRKIRTIDRSMINSIILHKH